MNQIKTMQCGRFQLSFKRPLIMGILNVTPDSFSDGAKYNRLDLAIEHAKQLIAQGADIIDIGGESTRPGAEPVSLAQELDRVIPIVEALHKENIVLSVDTFKPEVMQAALDAGADMINDVYALRQPGAIEVIAKHEHCGICIMHMQGEPKTMQTNPQYGNVLQDVQDFLKDRVQALLKAGVKPNRISIDPGFGFGKTVEQNFQLLRNLQQLSIMDLTILLGLSRKSMIGAATGKAVNERLVGSVTAAVLGVQNGANIVRVHDVAATKDALAVYFATYGE